MTARQTYGRPGAPGPDALLAKYISDLLIPAVTKATIDLWVASDQLASYSYAHHPYMKRGPYEVTVVQNLVEALVTHGNVHGVPVWEAGFRSSPVGSGRPKAVDIVLEDDASTAHEKKALLEFGVGAGFDGRSRTKIREDLKKLTEIEHHGQPLTGMKQMHFVSVTANRSAKAYNDFISTARAAVPPAEGTLLYARRFPIYRPDGWAYVSIGSYKPA